MIEGDGAHRRKPAEGERGAILVETSLVVGIILTFLLFSVQVGVLGFIQITADAGSYVAARAATLSTAAPGAYTAAQFDQIRPGDVSTGSPVPAPVSTVPVDYGYNQPSADPAQYQFQRVGGYSQLQPVRQTVTVTPSKVLSVAGLMNHVTGTDTEAKWTECGAHFNVAGSTAQCGAGGAPVNFQTDYITNGENTPPYYVGFNLVQVCNAQQPWGYIDGTCPSSPGSGFYALGVAEQLDHYNWTRTTLGVQSATDAFYEAGCHQAYFAQLAQFFAQYVTLRDLYNANYNTMRAQILSQSVHNFSSWQGFADPNRNRDVDTIYGWDVVATQGAALGSDMTTPSTGCGSAP